MAYIERRKTNEGKIRYRALVRLRGAPAQSATFRSKTKAQIWAKKVETDIREGRHFKWAEARKHTFGELVERYIGTVLSRRTPKKREDPERHLRWWKQHLGAYVLADVTPALVVETRDLLEQRSEDKGHQRSPATVNRYLGSLSHAFSVAEREWGWLQENPIRKVSRLQEPRGRVRFLDEDEKDRLLAACKESREPRLFPLVVLALSTGARRGELLGLRWPDIDLEREMAVLHKTKNRERRALPLQGLAQEVLRDLRQVRRIDTNLVFVNAKGVATFPRDAWERALKVAGIEDFRWHDLRHTAASYLAMSGATLAEIAEVLGHKTLAMVKRYAHLTEQHTSAVVARMNEKFLSS